MRHNILIVGKGFIGKRLHETLKCAITNRRVNTLKDAEKIIKDYKPKALINCIGFTGEKNVDGCEDKPEKTLSANSFVPVILAEAALRNGVKMVHISSGCIYHFNYKKPRPIPESVEPDYFDLYYSRSKIYAEKALLTLSRQYNVLVTRIRLPLDNRKHPKNILTKVLKFNKIIDAPNSITYIPDFIMALRHLIKIDARGLFNVVNKGTLRYPDILSIYQRYHPEYHYKTIPIKDLKMNRTNLILTCTKLEKTGFRVRRVKDILEECVSGYIHGAKK